MPSEVTVANLPSVAIWIVAISQLLLALGVLAILATTGAHIISILKETNDLVKQIQGTVNEVTRTVEESRREILPAVKTKLENGNLPI
jgi:uncharacterized protein YoxC